MTDRPDDSFTRRFAPATGTPLVVKARVTARTKLIIGVVLFDVVVGLALLWWFVL